MSKVNFKINLLATSVAVGISSLAAMPAMAAEDTDKVSKKIEAIQVTGMRASQKQALNVKRFANAVVDSISAEDIGKFPDKNIAESLQRITGVSITRNFGEGERVSIRGTTESQNRTLLNGQAVGSADWWTNSAASSSPATGN